MRAKESFRIGFSTTASVYPAAAEHRLEARRHGQSRARIIATHPGLDGRMLELVSFYAEAAPLPAANYLK